MPVDRHMADAYVQRTELVGDLFRGSTVRRPTVLLRVHTPPTHDALSVGCGGADHWHAPGLCLAGRAAVACPDRSSHYGGSRDCRAGTALQDLGNAAERTPIPFQHGQGVSFRLGSWEYVGDRLLPEKSLPACQFTPASSGAVGVALTLLTCDV